MRGRIVQEIINIPKDCYCCNEVDEFGYCHWINAEIQHVCEVGKRHPDCPIKPWHGEWVEQRDMAEFGFKFYSCTQCGTVRVIDTLLDDISNYKFCANCGADMRGEDE